MFEKFDMVVQLKTLTKMFIIKLYQRNSRTAPFNVNNCFNTNIHSYLETSDGQSSYLYLNVVHFFNAHVN